MDDFFKSNKDYSLRSSYYECTNTFTLEEMYQAFRGRLIKEEHLLRKIFCDEFEKCKICTKKDSK